MLYGQKTGGAALKKAVPPFFMELFQELLIDYLKSEKQAFPLWRKADIAADELFASIVTEQ